jgi:hypothetical protein
MVGRRAEVPSGSNSEGARVRVRIGVADTDRVVELDIEDHNAFVTEIEEAFATGKLMLWITDVKGRRLGLPLGRIGFVEVETAGERSVGFSPGAS